MVEKILDHKTDIPYKKNNWNLSKFRTATNRALWQVSVSALAPRRCRWYRQLRSRRNALRPSAATRATAIASPERTATSSRIRMLCGRAYTPRMQAVC